MPTMNICPTASRTANRSTSSVFSSEATRVSSDTLSDDCDDSPPHPTSATRENTTNAQSAPRTGRYDEHVGILGFKLLPPATRRSVYRRESPGSRVSILRARHAARDGCFLRYASRALRPGQAHRAVAYAGGRLPHDDAGAAQLGDASSCRLEVEGLKRVSKPSSNSWVGAILHRALPDPDRALV